MELKRPADAVAGAAFDAEVASKVEKYIAAEEGDAHRWQGAMALFVTGLAVAMSVFHLYSAYGIVATQTLRPLHVGFVLVLIFLLFPLAARWRDRFMWWDGLAALAAIATIAYMLIGGDDFGDRNTSPNRTDIALGILFIALVLEATRRTIGWIVPAVTMGFIAYAMFGPYLPPPWTHRGYDLDRLVGHLYMTLEGIFGVAVDVSSSLIILFTIFGAILQFSGAGKFFIDFSFAATGGKRASAGRSVVLASFLLGGPSGSGVATTVTLGSVAHPMLAKAGYGKDAAGGLLAAGGLGAILSPPVLGAAAFLIAEFLKISYLDVIRMAVIPTCLYYLSLLVMVEIDSRRFGVGAVPFEKAESLGKLIREHGFHFVSLVSIVVFMMLGYSPILSVFWATVVAYAMSFLRRDSALGPTKLGHALARGSIGMLNVGATCAAAGIIVGVVTLTGLGLKFSSIAIAYAGGSLVLTAIYTALIVWVVGLAVPVTASYIICAVIAAPALIQLGVPNYAAHMFIFYYAVLSEVSPPTALSPFAAAAITGGDPYRTTLQAWKYTMPAFLVPFIFVLDPAGVGLLLNLPKGGSAVDIVWITVVSAVGLAALAGAVSGWALRATSIDERIALTVAGMLLVAPRIVGSLLSSTTGLELAHAQPIGLALAAAVLAKQAFVKPRS
jgi:TRAP transporter 4TM/12TM fusion protein